MIHLAVSNLVIIFTSLSKLLPTERRLQEGGAFVREQHELVKKKDEGGSKVRTKALKTQ